MSVLKGYTSKIRQSIGTIITDLFATFQPIRAMQVGMDVIAHGWIRTVGTDAAEAGTTAAIIKATGHAAQVGDIINFTSGALDGHEVKVIKVEANYIYLGEDLSAVPGTGDTFEIERHKYPKVNDDGDLNVSVTSTGVIAFNRNAVATEVTEDTVTPANNRPLPVKLMGVNGALSVTTDVLDISSTFATDSMDVSGSTVTANLGATDNAILDDLLLATHRNVVGNDFLDMGSTNITTAAWVTLVTLSAAKAFKVQIFEGFGAPLLFGIGMGGAEVIKFIVPPGGCEIEHEIPAGSRIAVKAISGTSNSGYITINLIG